ncbi:hypothetical protein GOV08_02640 [Candidatus Woesearchaeota archaeon]|nr:hypothetical protein [Candidatus Woesearchaeota archaeon]
MAELGDKIGSYGFLGGVAIALIFAFVAAAPWVAYLLGFLGLVVGFLNWGDKEAQGFLIAAIAFLAASGGLGQIFAEVPYLEAFLENLTTLIGPAAVIIALKVIYDFGKG